MSKKISNVWSIIHNMELSTGVKVGFFLANTWWNKTRIFLYRDENDKGQDLSYFERIFWTFHPNLDVSHPIKLVPQKSFQIDTDLVALIVNDTPEKSIWKPAWLLNPCLNTFHRNFSRLRLYAKNGIFANAIFMSLLRFWNSDCWSQIKIFKVEIQTAAGSIALTANHRRYILKTCLRMLLFHADNDNVSPTASWNAEFAPLRKMTGWNKRFLYRNILNSPDEHIVDNIECVQVHDELL